MNYFKQIVKTINTSLDDYNIFEIINAKNINVYLNGILLNNNEHYSVINNKIIFNKKVLKNSDYICIDYMNDMETHKIYNKINKLIYYYNDNNIFLVNIKQENSFVNIYINGILQDNNYEYIIENDIIRYVQINSELKKDDIIILECIEYERSEE